MRSFKLTLASMGIALAAMAPLANATDYKCVAENGCDYNFYDGSQWRLRHVAEGTRISLDGLKELVGEGWTPIGGS